METYELEEKIREASLFYLNGNGDKEKRMADLADLSVKYLELGGTAVGLNNLIGEGSEKKE